MQNKRLILYASVIVSILAVIGVIFVLTGSSDNPTSETGHKEKSEDFERGPHGGRLLRNGDFALEITIFETNVAPIFRLYAFDKERALPPSKFRARISLSRLDGEVNTFTFKPNEDYLEASSGVAEPHSFDVSVEAGFEKTSHKWSYSSYEGRTIIAPEAAKIGGVVTEVAGPLSITETLRVSGRIILDPNKSSYLGARFPGVIKQIRKDVGDNVKAGETLAVIETNDSLAIYDLKTPITGKILSRNGRIGDLTSDAPLFVIADLSTVLAEFPVFSQDVDRVRLGQQVTISSLDGQKTATATINLMSPIADPESQSAFVRANISNSENQWQPGFVIRGEIIVKKKIAPLAVRSSALQHFRDFQVVFAQVGNTYEVRMLDLGVNDGTNVEVISGLKPGTRYVTENSFLVKADIEKSGASHDH